MPFAHRSLMSRHWRRILVLLVLAVGTFAAAIVTQDYMLAIFALLASVFGFAGYAVGLAHFAGRPDDRADTEGKQRGAPF
jgi:hypothetical protein